MARSSLVSAGIWGAVYDRLQERRSFATPGDLARYLNPRIVDTPALELIDEKLVHLVHSHDGRLIISVPPQEGKSERGAFAFPLWALMRDPSLRIAIASYSHDVAARWGRRIKQAIEAHPELGLSIRFGAGKQHEWELSSCGGGIFTAGVGGDWNTRKANGVPPGFSSSYATAVTPTSGTPWGYTGAFGGLPVGANHTLSVNFVSNTGKFSALVWLYAPTGQAPFVIEVLGGAAVSYRTPSDVHYAGNGFFLYRISGDVVAGAAAAIRFTVSDAGGVARTIYLGAAFVSDSKAALFPSYAEPIAAETSHAAGAEIKRGVRAQGYVTGSPHIDIVVTYGEVFRAALVGVPVWSVKPAAGYEGKMSKTELISVTNAGFTVRLYYSIDWAGEIHWSSVSA